MGRSKESLTESAKNIKTDTKLLFYNFHVTQHKCHNSSWIVIRQTLKFIVEPCWQYALLQQQCVDTVPSHASRFISRTPNGTTYSSCWEPSHPITHSHRLLEILDTVAEQSNCRLLALTVFTWFPQPLEYTGGDVTSLIHGKLYKPTSQWQWWIVLFCSDELGATWEFVLPSGWC